MNSFIPWVGGKSKLLWIINKMAPDHYSRFIDVFGGSGTVTMSRPIQQGCMEVYNDFNSNLTNLFCCVKNRPLALLAELGFLPLNTRDDFNVLYKFLSKGEITDDYLQEEMELTEILLKPPEAEAIRTLLLERAPRGDVRRAADFFKLVRYSFSGSSKSFGGKPCDIRRFFHLIWECSRRLANVIVENKDFEDVIRQYDRGDAWIYCDPPYFEAECYEVAFPKENHQRLHDTLLNCHGYVMVSYNYCPYICELYQEFYIFRVVRPNSMSQTAGSEYEEVMPPFDVLPLFSAGRSRRLTLVPIIQSLAQLEKNYGKEGSEIIQDNCQDTIFGGFAPNSQTAEVLSKALGNRTVLSGSVSRGKNDPSQSLQMMERPLLTPDELKSIPKGNFIVQKTGQHPMRTRLRLFLEWGITFEEPYIVPERADRAVAYANREDLEHNLLKSNKAEDVDVSGAYAVSGRGGIAHEPAVDKPRRRGGKQMKTYGEEDL